ncbi:hypothetical protein BDL97_15G102700 [Sphagnum fallax]|nr:hypothetical protein BDL97_15G102700 [Sphagnum fallax]KAH8940690.1 hypothetical protein BDL97_15G102700 [Sphagnum fallax]
MAMAVGVGTPPTIAPLQALMSSTQRACAIRPSSSNTLSSLVYSEELSVRRRNARLTWSPLKVRSIAAGPPKSAAETDWRTKRETLLKNGLRSVTAKDALRLQKEQGYTILDVRLESDFEEAHPEGAINVQVYRLIKEWTPWDIARRVAFAFFGIFQGTEENPEFLKEVNSKLDKSTKTIVACQSGGTVKPTANLSEGQQSRSLIAAYLLSLDGYKTIVHIDGGLRNWFKDGLPVVYKEEN